jgi:putative ABC transport system ATP-binding protein
MIELMEVTKVFNQGKPNEFCGLRGISLALARRQITVFKGPSGSGKTTLLALIGCLARPTAGRITLDGRLLSALPERFLTAVRRHTFGFIFQQFNLIKGLTVLENVILPAYPLGWDYADLVKTAQRLLQQMSLQTKADCRVEWLSGGEAQRTAIARALINNPDILIADEPTANLDSALSRDLMASFSDLKTRGKTVLISSHDPLIYQSAAVDRVITLRDGGLAEDAGC